MGTQKVRLSSGERERRWAFDVEMYYRWKDLRDSCTFQILKDKCQEHMNRIKSQYPNHSKSFEE